MNLHALKEQAKNQFPFLIGIPALLWQVLFFYAPLLFITYLSFLQYQTGTNTYVFGLDNYKALFNSLFFSVIGKSFLLAFFTACCCLLAAYPLAYFIAFRAQRLKTFYLFLLIVPFWTNFLLHIYAWFFVLEREGFINMFLLWTGIIKEPILLLNSLPAIALVMFYCYLPFMVLPIYSMLDKFDKRLLEASADLGAHGMQTFFRVTIPLTMPGLITGFFLVFVPAFGEFAITALIGGDRIMFAGSLITYLFLQGKNQPLGAAFVLLSSVTLMIGSWLLLKIVKRT